MASRHGLEQPNTGRITRSKIGTPKPIYDPKSLVPGCEPSTRANIALYSLNDEPQTVKEAKESKDWDKWRTAMEEEIQALEETIPGL